MAKSKQPTETEYFPCPPGVNVADHVTLKLCPTNYFAWKQLMLSFLESQKLNGFVDGSIPPPSLVRQSWAFEEKRLAEEEKVELKRREDWDKQWQAWEKKSELVPECKREYWVQEHKRVDAWEDERWQQWKTEKECREAKWKREREQEQLQESLEKTSREKAKRVLDQEREHQKERQQTWQQEQDLKLKQEQERREKWKQNWENKWKESQEEKELWQEEKELWQELDRETKRRNEWNRMRESGEKQKWERREEWECGKKLQLDIRDMFRGEDRKNKVSKRMHTEWKRSNGLVMGWILAMVSEEILVQVINLKTARDVWKKIEKIFTPPFNLLSRVELIEWTEQRTGDILSRYVELHKAALTANWEKAKEFLYSEPDAVIQPITWCFETALIVAVRSDKRNKFVEELIARMKWESKKRETIEWMKKEIMKEKEGKELEKTRKRTDQMESMEHIRMERMERMEKIQNRMNEIEIKEHTRKEIKKKREKREREMMERSGKERERMEMSERSDREKERSELERIEKEEQELILDEIKEHLEERQEEQGTMGQSVSLLVQTDISGATALHAAVKGGNIEAARWLVEANPILANIGDTYGTLPVHVAARLGMTEMVDVLLEHTKLSENELALKLLHSLASSGLYGYALKFLQDHNIKFESMELSPLAVIAQRRTSFCSGADFNFLQRLIYYVVPLELEDVANPPQKTDEESGQSRVSTPISVWPKLKFRYAVRQMSKYWNIAKKTVIAVPQIKCIRETKLTHHQVLELVKCLCKEVVKTNFPNAAEIFTESLRNATCAGIHEIVEEILDSFPSAIHLRSEKDQSLFHLAIVYRRESVFNLIYQMEEDQRVLLSTPDASTNNALHLVGNLDKQQQILLRERAAGAALQMQLELQWFKEVEKWILPQAKDHSNAGGKTPQEVFTETHKDLVKEGEHWMKDTANSCSIVAVLITTIVFAAAITVPGGSYNDSPAPIDERGLPVRLGNLAFTLFGIFDALALFSSSASLLMFLSILTCRYGEQDFLEYLPRRMIIGQASLFVSIMSMMVAFGATLRIVFGESKAWIVYPVVVSCCVPITLFAALQFPLLFRMIRSTYFPRTFGKHPRIFGKQQDRILH